MEIDFNTKLYLYTFQEDVASFRGTGLSKPTELTLGELQTDLENAQNGEDYKYPISFEMVEDGAEIADVVGAIYRAGKFKLEDTQGGGETFYLTTNPNFTIDDEYDDED